MKETPIIMSGNHPKLILDLLKTMTRRTWGLEEINKDPDKCELVWFNPRTGIAKFSTINIVSDQPGESHLEPLEITTKCPYGQVDDRLWVKETWATEKRLDKISGVELGNAADVALWYKAGEIPSVSLERGRWRSSRFMPRWASRILLEITEVRVERVQDISPQDIRLEGINPLRTDFDQPITQYEAIDRRAFQELWDSLNAKRGYSFEANPWDWPISFKVVLSGSA